MEHSHERKGAVNAEDEQDVSHIKNPDVAHEESDVNVRLIVGFGVVLTVAVAITYFIISGLFRFFDAQEARAGQAEIPLSKVPFSQKELVPPKPYLQGAPYSPVHPLKDWDDYEREQNAILNNYQWIDQSTGTVRLPIEEAKRVLATKGLPARPAPGEGRSASAWAELPMESSSGRTMEKRDK